MNDTEFRPALSLFPLSRDTFYPRDSISSDKASGNRVNLSVTVGATLDIIAMLKIMFDSFPLWF